MNGDAKTMIRMKRKGINCMDTMNRKSGVSLSFQFIFKGTARARNLIVADAGLSSLTLFSEYGSLF